MKTEEPTNKELLEAIQELQKYMEEHKRDDYSVPRRELFPVYVPIPYPDPWRYPYYTPYYADPYWMYPYVTWSDVSTSNAILNYT